MLHYQSTSFHDALYLRRILNLRPAPEFEAWLASPHHHEIHRLHNSSLLLP
jgi:ethanolamine ammonia-lyase large subunit